jgi:hypothetical protein
MSVVSRYMANSDREHWKVVQWIFIYMHGSPNTCLCFDKSGDGLFGYIHSYHVVDLDKMRFLSGYVFIVGGCAVSRKTCLQPYCRYVYHRSYEGSFMVKRSLFWAMLC